MGGSPSPPSNNYTTVEQSGFADDQYRDLRQANTNNRININQTTKDQGRSTRDTFNRGLNAAEDSLTAQAQNTRDAIGNAAQRTSSEIRTENNLVRNDLDAGFAGVGNQFNNMSGEIDAVGDQVSGVGNQVSNLGTNINAGFDDTAETINSGFLSQAGMFNNGMNAAAVDRLQGFTGLSDLLNSGFGAATSQLNDTQQAILSGQGNMSNTMAQNRGALDTYYEGLSEGQQGLQADLGTLSGEVGDFRGDFAQEASLAQRDRSDIQKGLEGGFAAQNRQADAANTAAQRGQEQLMQAVAGGGMATPQQSGGAAPQTAAQGAAQQGQIAGLLSTAQQAASNPNIDPNLRSRFGIVATSFGPDGGLIPQTTTESGNRIIRQLDGGGNLRFQNFNPAGQALSSGMLNVPETLNTLQSLSGQGGGSTGFATPFGQTMG